VVATGIEQAVDCQGSRARGGPQQRPLWPRRTAALPTLPAKLRADNQRAVAATAQKSDAPRPQAAPAAARAPANSIERAALAAIAAAVAPEIDAADRSGVDAAGHRTATSPLRP